MTTTMMMRRCNVVREHIDTSLSESECLRMCLIASTEIATDLFELLFSHGVQKSCIRCKDAISFNADSLKKVLKHHKPCKTSLEHATEFERTEFGAAAISTIETAIRSSLRETDVSNAWKNSQTRCRAVFAIVSIGGLDAFDSVLTVYGTDKRRLLDARETLLGSVDLMAFVHVLESVSASVS
jgi:hypothetical protein